jgi:hypothetical protein
MAKNKAKVNFDIKPIEQQFNSAAQRAKLKATRKIASFIEQKMKDLISKGISPIFGKGRFEGYAAQRYGKQKKKFYPDSVKKDFPSKRRRPVNLFLSGDFLKSLKAYPVSVGKIFIGYTTKYGKKLESGHRDGVNGQPNRPTIPEKPNERFAQPILSGIIKLFRDSFSDELKKKG